MTEFPSNKLYHESAFRYLLDNEAARSRRSGLGYHVLLVYRDTADETIVSMNAKVVASVVKVLAVCLRETDYIGWYRDGQVVGGVLTALGKEFNADQAESLRRRIMDTLCGELGEAAVGSFQVRVFSPDKWAARCEQEADRCPVHPPTHDAADGYTAGDVSYDAVARKGSVSSR